MSMPILPLTSITFNIPGGGVQTITLASALPAITNPVFVDGTSQPGWTAGTPVIEINGTNAGASVDGISIAGGNTTVRGLVINRFSRHGIALVQNGGDTITANFIGINAAGNAALGNGADGIFAGTANNTIGGAGAATRNIISGNGSSGIEINGASSGGNVIEGNYIGLNAAGTAAIPNVGSGISVFAVTSDNTIGGTAAGAGNVISGNAGVGILIFGSGANSNLVQGNLIGTNAAGTASVGNGQSGILLLNGTASNLIGGETAAARNVISGNQTFGVQISDTGTNANLVEGNYIGTDVTGGTAIPNKSNGVEIQGGAQTNTVGGTSAGDGNVISGNTGAGVGFSDSATSSNLVYGNFIGTNAAGNSAVPNNIGVLFVNNSGGNVVGGPEPGAARNIISGNTTAGVSMNTVPGNVIAGNYIGTDITGTSALSNNVGVFLGPNETLDSVIGGTAQERAM